MLSPFEQCLQICSNDMYKLYHCKRSQAFRPLFLWHVTIKTGILTVGNFPGVEFHFTCLCGIFIPA